MALSPKEPKRKKIVPGDEQGPRIPWVSWIAIVLGVGLSLMGVMVLLWGFAWQTGVGEPQNIDGDELTGNACLIPFGGASLTIGILWLITGWRGFRKVGLEEGTRPCPFCGKLVETDLAFCYFCNRSFVDEDEEKGNRGDEKAEAGDRRAEQSEPAEGTTRRARSLDPGKRS